jgi:hypothetical protein
MPDPHPATSPSWHAELRGRVAYLWPLKALGTAGFMFLFFQAYFYVQDNPLRTPYVMPEIWLDHWVPLVPWSFWIYASLWVYVSLAPAMVGNFQGLARFGLWISLMCLGCLAVFWFLPTQVPAFPVDWSQYPALSLVKGIDAGANACPSLHVASAVFAGYWMHHLLGAMRAPMPWRVINAAGTLAIAWSTLATHQHVAIDALCGAVVGAVFARLSLNAPALRYEPPRR